ncbi:MAG: hypothetical protein BAJATHORv1_70095 [Candidatus Thorarchaeota archaeon]|nr:MAG: hypothetical protein BAJATHORv1_70095 [Candidatus Thorarchaeota archaeon]
MSQIDLTTIRHILIMNKEGGEPLLNLPYQEMITDPALISALFRAVMDFLGQGLRQIAWQNKRYIFEGGEFSIVVAGLGKVDDVTNYQDKLKIILDDFEKKHSRKTLTMGDMRPFKEDALFILRQFPMGDIDLDYSPVATRGREFNWRVGVLDEKIERLLKFADGKRSVRQILDSIPIPENEVLGIFSILHRYGWVKFRRLIRDDDILILQKRGDISIEAPDLIKSFDGVKTFREVKEAVPYEPSVTVFLTSKLVESGHLKFLDN